MVSDARRLSPKSSIRLATRDDDERLIDLWSKHGGWGPIGPDFWQAVMVDGPEGPATIVIYEEGDRLVGQFIFLRALVTERGRSVPVLRAFTPVVDLGDRRWIGRDHPVLAMLNFVLDSLADFDVELLYGLPDPRWRAMIKRSTSLATTHFPLWTLAIPARALPELPAGAEVVDVDPFDERLASLCVASSRLHPVWAARQPSSFLWRSIILKQSLVGVERDGELVAVTEVRLKGDRQALLGTILSRDGGESLRAGLAAAVHDASEHAAGWEIVKLGVLVSGPLREHAEALGFARDDYDFLFCVGTAGDEMKDTFAPERWYVSGSD